MYNNVYCKGIFFFKSFFSTKNVKSKCENADAPLTHFYEFGNRLLFQSKKKRNFYTLDPYIYKSLCPYIYIYLPMELYYLLFNLRSRSIYRLFIHMRLRKNKINVIGKVNNVQVLFFITASHLKTLTI